jgi:hypothetical protein
MKYRYLALMLLILLAMPTVFGQEKKYVIIAHPELSGTQMKKSDLKSIFLGRKKQWENGTRVILALQSDKTVFEAFSRSVLSKTMRQYIMYWKRMIMTGRGSMPKQFKAAADAVAFVAKTKGAVAIIADTSTLTGVTVLTMK